jgi:hypothetical protein
MCFSAPASFIASGGLAALGGASLAMAKKEDKALALVPILFSIQQASEGVQWLYLNSGSSSLTAAYSFLFFALIIWPVYVPIFVFSMDKKRRADLKWFILLGIAVSAYYIALLLTRSLGVSKLDHCVSYAFSFPFKDLVIPAYIAAVVGPLLVSSLRIFRWFGIIVAVLGIISWIFFTATLTSVWCFFAAIVSSMFFLYIRSKNLISQRHRKAGHCPS